MHPRNRAIGPNVVLISDGGIAAIKISASAPNNAKSHLFTSSRPDLLKTILQRRNSSRR
jgi:hypothetical protein